MTRTRYYLGLTTRDGKPVDDGQRADAVATAAYAHAGGCTVYRATGYWRGATGYWRGTREETLVLEALDVDGYESPVSDALARSLGAIMEQDTVLWTREEVAGGFVKVPR